MPSPSTPRLALRPELERDFLKSMRMSRESAWRALNTSMLIGYWKLGRHIADEEKKLGAAARPALLAALSGLAAPLFGPGYDPGVLDELRRFYLAFRDFDDLRHELGWAHYRALARVAPRERRMRLLNAAIENQWDAAALEAAIKAGHKGVKGRAASQGVTPLHQVLDAETAKFLGTDRR